MFLAQIGPMPLALKQEYWLAILQNCVINLLTLLQADVSMQLRRYFRGIEHVIAKCADEWHDESILRCLFCLDVRQLLGQIHCKFADSISEIHHPLLTALGWPSGSA